MPAPNPGEILLSFVPGVRDWSGGCSGEPVLVLLGVGGEGGGDGGGVAAAVLLPSPASLPSSSPLAVVVVVGAVVVVVIIVVVVAGHAPSPGTQSVPPTHAFPFLFAGVVT